MDTWDAIRARRNVRQYADRPIDRADLERILEAGRRSPSSRNWQPWHFVVVTDRAQLEELSGVWRGAGHVASSAATVALVVAGKDQDEHPEWAQYDLGQATAYLMLAATDLGIGSAHAAVGDQSEAQRVLGLPGTHRCLYLVAFGYPADRPLQPLQRPDRRPFDDVVHWGRF